ncbi:hypothetical protein N8747_00690 [Candidatus Pelagibacter sp.]|nr:hypothetical protein [Candidatus Pelagibacter sp.]
MLINTIIVSKTHADSFKISKIEISEQFDLNFNKEKVFDTAFSKAFKQLISMIITTDDQKKIEKTSLSTIKKLIDSFVVSDEKFINNEYYAIFDVNFNKKDILKFFEKNNIFPSIPKKLNVLLIPVLIDIEQENLVLFNENSIYRNWNTDLKDHHLLKYVLPTEDLEDIQILKKNIKLVEDYNFNEITSKYDLNDFIVVIVYKNKNQIKILSKIKLIDSYKIFNKNYDNLDLSNNDLLQLLINDLKDDYDDSWKKLNRINTSIKLPLTISLSSNDYDKIQLFENTLDNLDLVSSFNIVSFSNNKIIYRIIYNGPPDKFILDMDRKNLFLNKDQQVWEIQ